MWLIDQMAERHIQDALQKGELSGLPGEGKPLMLDDDSQVPVELRSAYRLLKNSGYLPRNLNHVVRLLSWSIFYSNLILKIIRPLNIIKDYASWN